MLQSQHCYELLPRRRHLGSGQTNVQQHAFDKLKDSLTKSHVMSYFNPAQVTEVIVDASPVGLGGLLSQDGKVIRYASRAPSDVESRYSQTEKEMLAIVRASREHFHLYPYGSEFTIMTDHKPLLGIFNSHKNYFSSHGPMEAKVDAIQLPSCVSPWKGC